MATLTKGRTFVSGETVTPAKLNDLVDQATISGIVNADIDANAAIALSKLNLGSGITSSQIADGAVTGAAGGGKIAASAITGQTQLADPLASGDEFLVHDTSASALRRVAWSAMQPAGSVLNTVQSENTTFTTITAAIPDDDTIPQNTEGTEVLTATITPSSASNKVLVSVVIQGNTQLDNGNNGSVAAVFTGSNANAIAASYSQSFRAMNTIQPIVYLHSPNTTSVITYKVRVGAILSGNFYLNGSYLGAARLGGTMRSTLTLQEIKG